ncbi:copper chaperone PCu(A)C [Gracilimonas sp. Q87]|uniref:copper chaperone PCu(A)C n=1 Tax=Gracilimonas sp. Q87 TaxID=3384766 RepID=UPI00398424D0
MRNLLIGLLALGILVSACSTEKKQETEAGVIEEPVEQRVRPAASGGTSAAYFTYTNKLNEPDTLLGVSSAVAALTQIHETYETEDGMMGMREKKNLSVQPKDTMVFKQGGLHVMLIQLDKNLSTGDSVSVILQLSKAGEIEIKLPVKN